MRRLRLAACLLLAACDAGTGGAPDLPPTFDLSVLGDLTVPPDFSIPLRSDPLSHPSGPAVVSQGGPALATIQAVTIVWAGDPLADARAQFAAWMVDSTYYDQLAEYGAHRGTALGPFALPGPPPANLDDAGVGPLLRAQINSGVLPPPVAGSLYIIYLPSGSTSSAGFGKGCQDYGGYHSFTNTGINSPGKMAYAIIPHCVDGDPEFDNDTIVASHEIGEAASDPYGTGWFDPDMPISEIGDLCTPLDYIISVDTDGGTQNYDISRLWSAQTAAAGKSDPCLPVPGKPYIYFNAAFAPDHQMVSVGNANSIDVELDIQPFAETQVGSISWQILMGPGPGFLFSTKKGEGVAGSTQPIMITVTQDAAFGPHLLELEARNKAYTNYYFGVIDVE
jgi:hypothetical protein